LTAATTFAAPAELLVVETCAVAVDAVLNAAGVKGGGTNGSTVDGLMTPSNTKRYET
jgi:hypothetical protein